MHYTFVNFAAIIPKYVGQEYLISSTLNEDLFNIPIRINICQKLSGFARSTIFSSISAKSAILLFRNDLGKFTEAIWPIFSVSMGVVSTDNNANFFVVIF